jgi:hypothetical protein
LDDVEGLIGTAHRVVLAVPQISEDWMKQGDAVTVRFDRRNSQVPIAFPALCW